MLFFGCCVWDLVSSEFPVFSSCARCNINCCKHHYCGGADMEKHEEEALDLLLSLQSEDDDAASNDVRDDEGPRGHHSSSPPPPPCDDPTGYCSAEEDLSRPKTNVTMAAFRDFVKDSLKDSNHTAAPASFSCRSEPPRLSSVFKPDFDQHSGLRIRDRLVAPDTLTSKFCDLHFVRLQGINRAGMRTNLQGSWATVGVLTEKGQPKLSAAGKNFMVWKLSSLDGALVSVFLFGGSYTEHWKESAGAVFAVFNAKVRLDERSKEMCLSVFKGDQMLKLGTSADYAVCKGKRKDGTSCTVVVNKKQQGEFCQYHLGTAYQKHRTHRAELNGGNLATAFSGPGTKRAQAVRPNVLSPTKETKFMRPLKHLTSPDLRKVLSNADSITSRSYSQGKRFLETLSQHTFEKEQNLKCMEKKSMLKNTESRKKARIPLAEKVGNIVPPTRGGVSQKVNSQVMELDAADGLDDDMEQAMTFLET
ncbi:hypothetical protein CY35_17G014400 [Sphagnum magellanicum]|nr:hypothetical protein CY35_17G014400 [Sphagnum magellanicum]